MDVQTAKADFKSMLETCYSVGTVEGFARKIRALVQSGETTWDELGFTNNQVAERLQKAKVRKTA